MEGRAQVFILRMRNNTFSTVTEMKKMDLEAGEGEDSSLSV